MKISIFSALLVLLSFSAFAQTLTITSNTNNVCVAPNTQATITLTISMQNPPAGAFTYLVYRTGNANAIEGPLPSTQTTVDLHPPENRTYFVVAKDGSNATIATSNSVNITYTEFEVKEKTPATSQVVKYTDPDYDLVNNLFDIPVGVNYNWTFTGPPTISSSIYKSGSNNRWYLNPNALDNGQVVDDQIEYTATSSNGLCSVTGTVTNTNLTIINDKATVPDFIKPISSLPVCENNRFFYAYASMIPSCLLDPNSISITVQGVTKTAAFSRKDEYSDNNLYLFSFDASVHNNYLIDISISNICNGDPIYSGQIPVFPTPPPTLSGLPLPDNNNDHEFNYLCNSSSDTILMRANPSGGSFYYQIYKWDGTDIDYVTYIPAAEFTYPGYTATADDPSLRPFIPSQLYEKFIKPYNDDSYVIAINYSGPEPCYNFTQRLLMFHTPVAATFTKTADTICLGQNAVFTVDYPGIVDGTDKFSWDFGDGTRLDFDTPTEVSHVYKQPGMYKVRFQTQIPGLPAPLCENDVIDTIWVGAQPISDFSVKKNFLNVNAEFKSKATIGVPNTSDNTDVIVKWDWIFEPGVSVSQITPDATHTYTALQKEPYEVLHITTSKWGCDDTATRYIPVFPIWTPTPSQGKLDEFASSDLNGWFHSGQYRNTDTTSSWVNRQPQAPQENTITAYPTGGDCWITGENSDPNSGYYNNENSWVESPIYDLRQLQLPMISLNTWTNTDNLFDGASVQYAFCDTTSFGSEKWYTLGSKNSGLEWYNSNTVISKPGNDLNGWTGDTSTQWKFSAYTLDEPLDSINALRALVRFRVVLGTNSDNTPVEKFDGFAFDNFYIGERNRKVLVEEFCDYKNQEVDLDSTFKDPQAIRIQYHLRTHNSDDEINNQNKAEPSARALLYGVGRQLPRGVIDGILSNNSLPLKSWALDDFYQRLLIVSPFDIKISYEVINGRLFITDSIEKTNMVSLPDPLVAQIAVVERNVIANNDTFTNVLRNMLPNSAGTRIDKNYDWTVDKAIVEPWSPFIKPASSLLVIAFIQNENTKEIYQTNYIEVDSTTAANLTLSTARNYGNSTASFSEIVLSPNPTYGDLRIQFNGILNESYTYTIVDGMGNTVRSARLQPNVNAAFISTSDLGAGIYHIMFEGEGQKIIKKFAVIK